MMPMEFRSESPVETLAWAEKLASVLQGDELFFLTGMMGAGKTLFCKGLARGMGIDSDEVVSPTFTLLNCYEGDRNHLYHLDLYRLGNQPGEIGFCPEIDDQLGHGVIVVEWAEYLSPSYWNLEQVVEVRFEIIGDQARRIVLNGFRGVQNRTLQKLR